MGVECASVGRGWILRTAAALSVAIGLLLPGSPSAHATPSPTSLSLGRSSTVVFTTNDLHAFVYELPFHTVGAGRYAAAFFPALGAGVVNIRDDFASGHLWARAPFGKLLPVYEQLAPRHQYVMYVLMDHPGRFVFPDAGFHVVSVHTRGTPVTFASQSLPINGGSPQVALGSMRSALATSDSSVTAVVVHYGHPTDRVWGGGACTAPLPVYPCGGPPPSPGTFNDRAYGGGADGDDPSAAFGQDITGTAYSARQPAAYVVGDFDLFHGAPFDTARLVAFGIQLHQ